MSTVTIAPHLQRALEAMSKDMAVDAQALVNQAVFAWLRINGYVTPAAQIAAPPEVPVGRAAPAVVAPPEVPVARVDAAPVAPRVEPVVAPPVAPVAAPAVAAEAPAATPTTTPDALPVALARMQAIDADLEKLTRSWPAWAQDAEEADDDESDDNDSDADDSDADESDADESDADESDADESDADDSDADDSDADDSDADESDADDADDADADDSDDSDEADAAESDDDGDSGDDAEAGDHDGEPVSEPAVAASPAADVDDEHLFDDRTAAAGPSEAPDSDWVVASPGARQLAASADDEAIDTDRHSARDDAEEPTRASGQSLSDEDGLDGNTGETEVEPPPDSTVVLKSNPIVLYLERDGEEPVRVLGERFVIGRGPQCDLVIDSPRVSREHAALVRSGVTYIIEDLNSSNGTWFGEERVTRKELESGDVINLGNEPVTFILRAE